MLQRGSEPRREGKQRGREEAEKCETDLFERWREGERGMRESGGREDWRVGGCGVMRWDSGTQNKVFTDLKKLGERPRGVG